MECFSFITCYYVIDNEQELVFQKERLQKEIISIKEELHDWRYKMKTSMRGK